MDGTKDWWDSKTIWSDLFTVLTGILVSFHVLTVAQASVVVSDGPTLVVGLTTTVLGFIGLYGRVVATKKIELKAT